MKQKVTEEIYKKYFNHSFKDIRFSDLPKDIQDDDIIEIHREDAMDSENDSYEAYTELVVFRQREETDEEYEIRLSDIKQYKEQERQYRYELYLELKSEFEKQ